MEMADTGRAAPPEPAPAAPQPAKSEPAKSQPPAAAAPSPQKPTVVWNRPVPGVTDQEVPTKPSTPVAETPKPDTKPQESGEDTSTSRLLRAKRRAKDNKDE
jgi:hypothetical protein